MLTLRDVRTRRASRLRAKFVMVTHGILAGQYTLAERGLDPGRAFAGTLSFAGREGGRDCAVSHQDLTGKARRCEQTACVAACAGCSIDCSATWACGACKSRPKTAAAEAWHCREASVLMTPCRRSLSEGCTVAKCS